MQAIIFILTCAVAFAIWQNWKLKKKYNNFADGAVREVTKLRKDMEGRFEESDKAWEVIARASYEYSNKNSLLDNIRKVATLISFENDSKTSIRLLNMHVPALAQYLKLEFRYDNTHNKIIYFKPKTKKGKK